MQNSRGLSDKVLMDIVDRLRNYEGLLSGEDVEELFSSQSDTLISKVPDTLEDNPEITGVGRYREKFLAEKEMISNTLSSFLSSIDQNLTSEQIRKIYENMFSTAVRAHNNNESFGKEEMVAYLNKYVKDNRKDLSQLTPDEIKAIVEEEGEDSYGNKTFIKRWPNEVSKDVFEEREMAKEEDLTLPLSIK